MKAQANRLARVEREALSSERQFVAWAGNPWTPELESEAIRREPEQRILWRSLVVEGRTTDYTEAHG